MHHYERDWFELWKSWWLVVECMLNWWIFVYDYGYCYCFPSNYCHLMFVDFFYNKLTLTIFVPCGWYLWWSRTFIHGSRQTTLEYAKWDSFVEPPSQHDDVGIILGESCVLLINSSVAGFVVFFYLGM